MIEADPLTVEVGGERRSAWADTGLVGEVEVGDEVIVNVQARDLGLGSGGFDIVHVNLTRGLRGGETEGIHVIKLNYTSLQHPVDPVEIEHGEPDLGPKPPTCVISLHGHLAPVAWAAQQARPGLRLGFVQAAGAALPGSLSRDLRRASRARARVRADHRRGVLRRRARGDHPGGRARCGRAPARLGRGRRRPGPGDPRLGDPARARGNGGARCRPRGAGARPADPAVPSALQLGRARATSRPQPSHRVGARALARPGPRPGPGGRARGVAAAQRRPRAGGRLGRGSARGADRALHGPSRPRGRVDRPRRLRGERAPREDDGADDRRGSRCSSPRRWPPDGRSRRRSTGRGWR